MTTAQAETGGATYRVLRELGARAQHTHAAIREPSELVVVQRFVRTPTHGGASPSGATPVTAEAMALLLRDARCLAKNWHPNVARVRHVDLLGAELTIATELVDGVTFADLLAAAEAERKSPRDPALPLPLLVRILVDVLGGLHGLHGLRDATNMPLDAVHGALCPANIVVGKDGVARLVAVFRPRPVKMADGSEALGYAAPEALDGSASGDVRADLYAVGVILWEALTGRRLWAETDAARVRARQREEELARPEVGDASPFARLADVAMRALSYDPALRHKSASEMATELRRIAGTRIAPGSAVAQRVAELAGDRIRARRASLDPSPRRRGGESLPPPEALDAEAPPADLPKTPADSAVVAKAPTIPPPDEPSSPKVDAEKKAAPKEEPSSPKIDAKAPKEEPSSPKVDAEKKAAPKEEPSSPKVEPEKKAAPKPAPLLPTRPADFKPVVPKFAPKLTPKPAATAAAKPASTNESATAAEPKSPVEKAIAPAAAIDVAIAEAPASPFAPAPSVAPTSETSAEPPAPVVPPPPFALAPSVAPPSEAKAAESPPKEEAIEAPSPLAPEPVAEVDERASLEPQSVDHLEVAAAPRGATAADAPATDDEGDAPRTPPRRKNLVPVVGAVVGLAVVVLVGGLLAMRGGDEKKPRAPSTSSVNASPPQVETASPPASATPPAPPTPVTPAASSAPAASATEPPTTTAAVAAPSAAPPPPGPAPVQPPTNAKPPGKKKKKKAYEPSGI